MKFAKLKHWYFEFKTWLIIIKSKVLGSGVMPEIFNLNNFTRKELNSIVKGCLKSLRNLGNGNLLSGTQALISTDPLVVQGEHLCKDNINIGDMVIFTKSISKTNSNKFDIAFVIDFDLPQNSSKVWVTKGNRPFKLDLKRIILSIPENDPLIKPNSILVRAKRGLDYVFKR